MIMQKQTKINAILISAPKCVIFPERLCDNSFEEILLGAISRLLVVKNFFNRKTAKILLPKSKQSSICNFKQLRTQLDFSTLYYLIPKFTFSTSFKLNISHFVSKTGSFIICFKLTMNWNIFSEMKGPLILQ